MNVMLHPYMPRSMPLLDLSGVVADRGYERVELSPYEDLIRSLVSAFASEVPARESCTFNLAEVERRMAASE